MRYLFLFAGLAAADAMFDDPMVHPQMKREILQPRQSLPDLSPSCTSALLGIYSGLPTPPARLVSAIGADGSNPCSVTVPSSLSSEYSSYESKISSWYSQSSDDVSSALNSCSELRSLATLLPVCVTSYLGGGGGGGAASGTGTDTASGASETGTDASSTMGGGGGGANSQSTDTGATSATDTSATDASATGTETDAAPRETGYAMAALAAAGAIAAVAAL